MLLQAISLYHVRNITEATVVFGGSTSIITGRNGQGKSNLVEAISLLAYGKSFRTSSLREITQWGEPACSVFGTFTSERGEEKIGVVITEGRREIIINDTSHRSLSALLGKVPLVTFAPADIELVRGTPSERRRFLDRHTVEVFPSTAPHLVAYQRALQQKNALLKDDPDPRAIASWNDILAREGSALLKARSQFVSSLSRQATIWYEKMAPEGEIFSLALLSDQEDNSPEAIRGRLEEAMRREMGAGISLVGPHRDDLLLSLHGHDARECASQGQVRSMVLALKLGVVALIEEVRGESPLIVLDDVAAELDAGRQGRFLSEVLQGKRQVFMTSTEKPAEIAGLEHRHIVARDGVFSPY